MLAKLWNSNSRFKISSLGLVRRNFSVSGGSVAEKAIRDGELRVFIVAGEVSGDTIGARFMSALKKLSPVPIRFSGVGG